MCVCVCVRASDNDTVKHGTNCGGADWDKNVADKKGVPPRPISLGLKVPVSFASSQYL